MPMTARPVATPVAENTHQALYAEMPRLLCVFFMLLKAAAYWLDRYDMLGNRQQTFTGGSYTDINALLPSGNAVDVVNGVAVTLIDNGMPCVVMKAADVGITGYEDRDWLDANTELKARIEAIRLAVGERMKADRTKLDKADPVKLARRYGIEPHHATAYLRLWRG